MKRESSGVLYILFYLFIFFISTNPFSSRNTAGPKIYASFKIRNRLGPAHWTRHFSKLSAIVLPKCGKNYMKKGAKSPLTYFISRAGYSLLVYWVLKKLIISSIKRDSEHKFGVRLFLPEIVLTEKKKVLKNNNYMCLVKNVFYHVIYHTGINLYVTQIYWVYQLLFERV